MSRIHWMTHSSEIHQHQIKERRRCRLGIESGIQIIRWNHYRIFGGFQYIGDVPNMIIPQIMFQLFDCNLSFHAETSLEPRLFAHGPHLASDS